MCVKGLSSDVCDVTLLKSNPYRADDLGTHCESSNHIAIHNECTMGNLTATSPGE
jgi:hypothetical protein